MRRRHMLGTHDKTLCGWSVTTGELTQLKKMDSKYVNCKRCLEKLDAANQPSSNLKNKRVIQNNYFKAAALEMISKFLLAKKS